MCKHSNDRGSALVITIIIFAVLSVLGVAVLNMSLAETRQVVHQQNKIQSHYVARSGADALASFLIENPDELENMLSKTATYPGVGLVNNKEFNVKVTGTIHQFLIESVALKDGVEDAKIYLEMKEYNLLDYAIFANEILDIGNNQVINGNIGTNGNSIGFGHETVDGNVTLGPGSTESDILEAEGKSTGLVSSLSKELIYPPIETSQFTGEWPGGNTYEVSDGTIEKMTISNLNIGSNEFYISGNGEVHLLVEESANPIRVVGNGGFRTSSDAKLFIYYNGSQNIRFDGKAGSNVFLYAPNADLTFNGGGSGEFTGSLIVNTFNGPSSGTVFKHDPNLLMEDLMIDGVAGYVRSTWKQ